MYRIIPSAVHEPMKPLDESEMGFDKRPTKHFITNFADSKKVHITPERMRWKPLKFKGEDGSKQIVNFVEGIKTMCGAGDPAMKDGLGIHAYSCNSSMFRTSFYSADGDMLIVP